MSSTIQNFRDYASRILSLEKSIVEIDKEALLSVALVFPNSYEVGMANLGFQTLYRLFNSYPGVRCERSFFYESFPEITRTLESAQKLIHFDIIAFSISFEVDYLNVLKILKNTGLNPYAKDRHPRDPLIMTGGTATFINPEPIAPFIDLFFIGEIEPAFDTLIEYLKLMKNGCDKNDVINQLSEEVEIYAPQFFDPSKKIIKVTANVKEAAPQFSSVITSKSHFQNMFLIEVGRGCGRYCRFCAASHIYHPVRFFSHEKILTSINENIHSTTKVGLVGAALCDYPKLIDLGKILVAKKYQLGLSSFRFETISRSFLNVVQHAGIKTITLAPEAGTIRLRKIINKPISNEQIMAAIDLIAKSEILNLKLYFLIGLPFEEEKDILGLIELVKQIKNIFFSFARKRREIVVSVNAFIPKPFTPFQWCAMENERNLKKKRRLIENELKKISGVKFTKKSTKAEIHQTILSLGDRHLAADLFSMPSSNHSTKLITGKKNRIFEEKSFHDTLPWDFIAHAFKKEKLWQNWQKTKELALY